MKIETNAQLIAELQKHSPDFKVIWHAPDGDCVPLGDIGIDGTCGDGSPGRPEEVLRIMLTEEWDDEFESAGPLRLPAEPSRPVEAAGPTDTQRLDWLQSSGMSLETWKAVIGYRSAVWNDHQGRDNKSPMYEAESVRTAIDAAMGAVPAPPADTPMPPSEPAKRTSCNRHNDCEQAEKDRLTRHPGTLPPFSFHCHNDECEECFGN